MSFLEEYWWRDPEPTAKKELLSRLWCKMVVLTKAQGQDPGTDRAAAQGL